MISIYFSLMRSWVGRSDWTSGRNHWSSLFSRVSHSGPRTIRLAGIFFIAMGKVQGSKPQGMLIPSLCLYNDCKQHITQSKSHSQVKVEEMGSSLIFVEKNCKGTRQRVDSRRSEECGPITQSTASDETMHASSCAQPASGVLCYLLVLRIAVINQKEIREYSQGRMCTLGVTHITCDSRGRNYGFLWLN